jgi:hypothetical protein
MSRGPGIKQRFLETLLEKMGNGFWLNDICVNPGDKQNYWRALKSSGLPFWQKMKGSPIWIGETPLLNHSDKIKGRSYGARRDYWKARKEYRALKNEYELKLEKITEGLSVDQFVCPARGISQHLKDRRERWEKIRKSLQDLKR